MLLAVVMASEYAPKVAAPPSLAASKLERKPRPRSMTMPAPNAEVPPMRLLATVFGIGTGPTWPNVSFISNLSSTLAAVMPIASLHAE
jgi:hypothetical protein